MQVVNWVSEVVNNSAIGHRATLLAIKLGDALEANPPAELPEISEAAILNTAERMGVFLTEKEHRPSC